MTRAAVAAALAVLAAAGCSGCGSPTYTVRAGPAIAPPPPLTTTVRALHFGDFGDPTRQRDAVAAAIARANARARFDLAFAAGDDIYECGPDPEVPGAEACAFAPDGNTVAPGFAAPADPSFRRAHEDALAPLRGVPIYLALGNHDVAARGTCGQPGAKPEALARLKACLEVAHRSPAWDMPGRHYVVDAGPARFIVIDSNLAVRDYGGFSLDDEVAFVAASATEAACGPGRSCFLVGHHPPASAGGHRIEPAFLARIDRLLAAGGGRIRAFLGGHDHDLQHLRTAAGLDVLVSGNTARGRKLERFGSVSPAGAQLLFASVAWGYGVLEVGAGGWRYRFEGDDGAPRHCCVARGTGPCEPTECQ